MRSYLNIEKLLSISLALFVLILMVDPANTLFGIKNIYFIFFVCLNALTYKKIDWQFIVVILLIYVMMILSYIRGKMMGYDFDNTFTIHMFKTFTPLILCFWAYKFRIIDKLTLPSLVIAFATFFVTTVLYFFPENLGPVYQYFDVDKDIMIISIRNFVGFEVSSVYYRSLPLLIIPASIYFYNYKFEKQSKLKNGILAAIFLTALFWGGTRACMLSAFIVVFLVFSKFLFNKKNGVILLTPIFIGGLILFLFVLYTLLSDTKEVSVSTKYGHISSIIEVFQNDPYALLFGNGPGSTFYSIGSKEIVAQVEWTYIEFVRMFGVFGAIFLLTFYYFPLWLIYKKSARLSNSFPFILGYLLYLLIGATNPLLIGSNGMLAVLTAYSYALNKSYET